MGDYVGDGALDLAVGLHTTQTINILENTGNGEFVDAMQSDVFGHLVVDLVATDLECDGEHEFFVVGYGPEVEWVRLSGGDFSAQTPIVVPEGGYSLAVGDLIPDEDNSPEIVVAVGHVTEDVVGSVQVIGRVDGELASGAGAMGYAGRSPWEITMLQTDQGARVLVADSDWFDLDEVGVAGDQHVSLLQASGDALGLVPDDRSPIAMDFQNPYAIAVGNFTTTNDVVQIAVAEKLVVGGVEDSITPGRVRVFELGDSGFAPVTSFDVEVGPRALAAADLDCDGYSDLVISNSGLAAPASPGGVLQVAYGGGDFGSPSTIESVFTGLQGGGTRIGVGDFDGDGVPSAAVADWGGARVFVIDHVP